jgi:hypothetical protein
MSAKRWVCGVVMAALIGSTGCCRFCERWCPPPGAACAPACCAPVQAAAPPTCPPGTVPVPAGYAPTNQQGWSRTYVQPANCCQ